MSNRIFLAALCAVLALLASAARAQFENTITIQRAFLVPANAGSYADVNATCPAGYDAISGGLDNLNSESFEITTLAPTFNGAALFVQPDGTRSAPNGWYASVINYATAARRVVVSVVCAQNTGIVVSVSSTTVTAATVSGPGDGVVGPYCPVGLSALAGGGDVSRPEAMKLASHSPVFDTNPIFTSGRAAGFNPPPGGWVGRVSNQGPNAGTMKVAAICANVAGLVAVVSSPVPVPFAQHTGSALLCPAGYIATGGGLDSAEAHGLIATASTPLYAGYSYPVDRSDDQYSAPSGWFADSFNHIESRSSNVYVAV